jgi:hypothetical protein
MLITLTVNDGDLEDFEKAICIAVVEKLEQPPSEPIRSEQPFDIEDVPRHFYQRNALVLSFDIQGRPFLLDSRGYNRNERRQPYPDRRWYLRRNRLLDRIGKELETIRGEGGGRVFIDISGVRTKEQERQYIDILNWTLPRESQLLRVRQRDEAARD